MSHRSSEGVKFTALRWTPSVGLQSSGSVASAAALILLMMVAGCRKAPPAAAAPVATDSVATLPPATGALEGVEESLRWWVYEVESRNGLDLVDSNVIHRSGSSWVVDVSNLPLWTLPEEDRVFQVGRTFPDSIRIDGASLCGDLPEGVRPWLDRAAPGWRSRQTCGGEAEAARLRQWMAAESGKVVAKQVLRAGGKGPIQGLVLACSGTEEINVGRLAMFRSLRRLELRGCRLATEQDGGSWSRSQHRLQWLPVQTLVLRKVFAPRLNLRSMPNVDSLEILGGNVSWLDLPARCLEGGEDCAEDQKITPDWVVLRDVPIVDPRQIDLIAATVDSFDGPGFTVEETEVVAASRRVVDLFFEASSEWTPDMLAYKSTPFPEEQLPERSKIRGLVARGVVPGTSSCMRSDYYKGDAYEVGPFATWTEQEGLVLVGDFGSRALGRLASGNNRMDVEEAIPGALLSAPNHLVWAEDDRIQLVAVFEQDVLIALFVPQGCRVEHLLDEINRRPASGESEGE